MANMIMHQDGFHIPVNDRVRLYMPRNVEDLWNLAELDAFIEFHRDQAALLAPRNADFGMVTSIEDFDALIHLCHLCTNLSGQQTFDPVEALWRFVGNHGIGDRRMAQVIPRFLQQGVEFVSQIILDDLEEMGYVHTLAVIQEFYREEIKDPGED